ncbi:MAG: hypothetical protein Q8K58_17010 [Acidimicrobiales bacterium]|nr:hypothetical protein [Acidimicrobiales bacterium]
MAAAVVLLSVAYCVFVFDDLAEDTCDPFGRYVANAEGFEDDYVTSAEVLDRRAFPPRLECRVEWSLSPTETQTTDGAYALIPPGLALSAGGALALRDEVQSRPKQWRRLGFASVAGLVLGALVAL